MNQLNLIHTHVTHQVSKDEKSDNPLSVNVWALSNVCYGYLNLGGEQFVNIYENKKVISE